MQAIAWLEKPLVIGQSTTEIVIGVISSFNDTSMVGAFSIDNGNATYADKFARIISLENADDLLWMVSDQDGNLLPGVIDTRTPQI